MGRAEPTLLHVEVVLAPGPRKTQGATLRLPEGSTLDDALQASGFAEQVRSGGFDCGVWGRRQPGTALLRDGDRVECWRALQVDPMQARRQRHEAQVRQKKRPATTGR